MIPNLIYQETNNPDSVIYSPELLDDQQSWAYLRSCQMSSHYNSGDEEQDQVLALQYGITSGKGLKSYLAAKQKSMDNKATAGNKQAADDAANSDSKDSLNFERMSGILDSDDPRFARLHRENLNNLQRGVEALSNHMGLAIDQFYATANETYRDIRHQANFSKDSLIPQANVKETCQSTLEIAKAPWQFGNLPGVYSRVPKLVQNPELLEKLHKKLIEMKPMAFWTEPLEFMPQPSESFIHTIKELLSTIAQKDLTKLNQADSKQLVGLQAYAIQSMFGLAVLSGSYEMIIQALNTIHDFTSKATEENINQVLVQCKPALETYLAQIVTVASEQREYHTFHADNISAVFGSQMKIYPSMSFSRNNTSIASDGAHIYLLIGQERHAMLYKIGTGMQGTLAGRVYLSRQGQHEGQVTWAFCKGKLYLRRAGDPIGTVHVLDPSDFKVVDEIRLDLDEKFKGSQELLRKNQNYPLLSDGDHLYTVVMSVEKRERPIAEEHKQLAEALKILKQEKRASQRKEAQEAREARAKEKEKKKQEKQKKNNADKKQSSKDDDKLSLSKLLKKDTLLEENVDEVDFYHGQQYFVVVYKALKFDLSRTKKGGLARCVQSEEESKDINNDIDFLSLSETSLFAMPIVQEMFATFSGFYNVKRCALALQHNNNDIHDAGQWLIEERDAPFFKAHALKTVEGPKKEPKVIEIAEEFLLSESVLRSKWDESSKENPEISTIVDILNTDCLECGKWTINGDQMTYVFDYKGSVANMVFSLKQEDIKLRKIPKNKQNGLESSSFENSRSQPTEKDGRVPVPSYISKRRGPGEENFDEEMNTLIRDKFDENDIDGNGNISMESFGSMMQDLSLLEDDDGEMMEEAFYGMDMDEKDTLNFDEFLLIAKRLNYKKKQKEDKRKMADITEEQIQKAFDEYKKFNQVLEEDCLTWQNCLYALQERFKIKMNPREYDQKFQEHDGNRDRCLSYEEFRRFMGKEPKDESERNKKQARKKQVFISNLVFFWDGSSWLSYTPQEVQEGTHTATLESKRSEIAKQDAEKAREYKWLTEWNLYEDISVRSANIFIEAERGRQLEHGAFYITYDKFSGKYVCMSLTHTFNFFMVEDLSRTIPRTFDQAPSTEITSVSQLTDCVLSILTWVNERRFKMPWRWALWSQTFINAIDFIEKDRKFLHESYQVEEATANDQKAQQDEAKASTLKRMRKRLQIFKEREVTRELYRLNQPIANNEQAIAYRAKKVQKDRQDKQKADGAKRDESAQSIDEYVLPLEKIYLPQENRKMFAFCTNGNDKVVKQIFKFLKASPQSLVCYRAMLDCFAYADQLMAYHDQSLMDKIRDFCVAQLQLAETQDEIKQYIWRLLVVGWYKFASNSEQQLKLLSLFVSQSTPLNALRIETGNWLEKLLSTRHLMTPIELFNHRFYSTPATFFFLEMIQISRVERYHVCLKSQELFNPQVICGEKKLSEDSKTEEQSKEKEASDAKESEKTNLVKLDMSVLSNTLIVDGQSKPSIVFRNKSKISLVSNFKDLLNCTQVNQSLAKVPIEYVELRNLKANSDPMLPVTETYFSMPLYQILNEEMINFDSPDLPKDDLDFLCQRYSDQQFLDTPDLTAKERKELQFQHLMSLREQNEEMREALIVSMLNAINQSQGTRADVQFAWDNESTPAMINVLRRLIQAAFAIVKVHNPRQLKGTINLLGQIDRAFSQMRTATDDFNHGKMTVVNFKWLEQMKSLFLTVVNNIECNLGYIMQTELAVNSLPLLMSIFENLRDLFKRQVTSTDEETKETSSRIVDILTNLTYLSIEGADSANCRIFDTSRQARETIRISKAIGYEIQFNSSQIGKNNSSSLNIHTSRSDYEISLRDLHHYKNLVLVGSTLTVKFNRAKGDSPDQGVKLMIMPIVGEPQLLPKNSKLSVKDLEWLLTQKTLQSDSNESSSGQVIISWLNLLNKAVFVMSFLNRGLLDNDLISLQTNGKLKTGAGIFKNFGKSSAQLLKDSEFDEALHYAQQRPSDDLIDGLNVATDGSIADTMAEMEKKHMLQWHLFKSGLILPQMEDKSVTECVQEGLRLVSESLLRRQDNTVATLALLNEDKNQAADQKTDSAALIKQKTSSFMRRQSTLMKNNEAAGKQQTRQDVWAENLTGILRAKGQDQEAMITRVVKKMRSGLIAEQFGYTSIWHVPNAKPFRQLWQKVQELFVASVLYHSDLIDQCQAFLDIPDAQCKEIKAILPQLDLQQQSLSVSERIVFQFELICKKVDSLLLWMKNRLDGQKYFNFTIENTVQIAKKLLIKAIGDHRQQEELKLMRQAEEETIAYNQWLKDKEAKEKEEEEKKQKEEEEQKKKRKQSAGKVRSSAPAGMRRNQRGKIQRLHRELPKAQPQKKDKAQRESAPAVIGSQSPLVTMPNTEQEVLSEEELADKVADDDKAEKAEAVALADLTDAELASVKKEIYDEAFKKFEEEYGNKLVQLCTFFDIESDNKDKSKTLREIFKNIKSRMISYIDFDNPSMPIPVKFDDKMIKIKNPYEEVANDVINRLNFLFEVKPSKSYRQTVIKKLNIVFKKVQGASFDDIEYQEDSKGEKMSTSAETSSNSQSLAIRQWSQVASENPKDLLRDNSSPLQAVFLFAKCSRLSNLAYLRNIMLDEIYLANFRLYGLQLLHQMGKKLSPTIFSRFIKGSIGYSLENSNLHGIETCGEVIGRKLNAISTQIVNHSMSAIFVLQRQLELAQEAIFEREDIEEGSGESLEHEGAACEGADAASSCEKQSQLSHRSQRPGLEVDLESERSERSRPAKKKKKKGKKKGRQPEPSIQAAADSESNRQQDYGHRFSSEGKSSFFERGNLQMPGSHVTSKQLALEKQLQKRASLELAQLIEIQRSILQHLNDIRVLLSNPYSKSYFISSLVHSDEVQTNESVLTIGKVTDFLNSIIQHIVKAQTKQDEFKEHFSRSQHTTSYTSQLRGAQQIVQIMRLQLACASQIILDLLFNSGNDEGCSRNQQLLHEVASEIIISQLEKICYQTRLNEQNVEETFIAINDIEQKDTFVQLLKLFSELNRGQDSMASEEQPRQVDAVHQTKMNKVAQLLANMILHVQTPEVMRTAIKSAKVYLHKVNLKDIRLLRSVNSIETCTQQDFISEAIRKIGAKISNSENEAASLADETASASNQKQSEQNEKEKVGETLDELMNAEKPGEMKPGSDKEYYVYTNLNCPLEEDFTFVITALWHWYKVNPHPNLKVIKDPAEITVEAPPEEEKKAEESKAEEEKKPEEEKKAEESKAEEEKKPEEEKKAEEGKAEEEKKPEEEKKGEPDAQEEEKKGEPDAAAVAEEEKKAEIEEEEKRQRAEEEAKEKARKEKEEAEAKERKLEEEAKQKIVDAHTSWTQKSILDALKKVWLDFEANDSWLEVIRCFKPETVAKEKTVAKKGEEPKEEVKSSIFAPSLKDILKDSELQFKEDFIKESSEKPKKIIELHQIIKQIIEETYKNPTTKDTQEVKEQKMKEKNFNNLLLAVLEEAVQIAQAMTQRRSVPIAGPFSLVKAHQLTQLLNRSYSKGLLPVPLLPFASQETIEKKIKFKESEICAKDIMPITDEKVRIHCGKPEPGSYFTRFTIAIAPKELKVTICEKQTAIEIEEELLKRGKLDQMDFQQCSKGSRGGGGLIHKPMPQPEPICAFKSFVEQTAQAKSAVIQELIQLVRYLMQDRRAVQSNKPLTLKRKSTRIVSEASENLEIGQGSILHDIITKINKMLEQIASSASWSSEFNQEQKQMIYGLITVIGGWQPCLVAGQLIQINSDSSGESKAIVINDNFGKGKISAIQLNTNIVKISQFEVDQVQPIYSTTIDLKGAFGRSIDTAQLFKAIMSLQKQIESEQANEIFEKQGLNTSDCIFSSGFLLQMLLKVATKLPLTRGNQSQAMIDLIQVLIKISERGQDDCEQEGKPQSFWATNLAKQWASLIDNAQDSSTNFYLPREFYQSKEQADEDSDLKVLAELDMKELIKRASTVVHENSFEDVNFVQNKNYYLTGLSEQVSDTQDKKSELSKTRKLKFYIDNVFPRAADVMSCDAYRGAHGMIQSVMLSVKGMLQMNWNMGIDELKYGCKGSEIYFPDQYWDWSQLFFDEISVDSWINLSLKQGRKKFTDEDEEDQEEKDHGKQLKPLNIPVLDKLINLGIHEILVQVKAIEFKRQSVLVEYTDQDSMTKHWLWAPISSLSKPSFLMEPASVSFLPQTLNKKFMQTLSNTAIAYARQSLLKIVHSLQSDSKEAHSMFKMPVENLKLHDIISWAVWENYGSKPIVGWMDDLSHVLVLDKVDQTQQSKLSKRLATTGDMNEDEASTVIRNIFEECVDQFSSLELTQDSADLDKDGGQASTETTNKSQTLSQVRDAFNELVVNFESEGAGFEESEPVKVFKDLVDYCANNWNALADAIASEKAAIDICKEFENLKRMKDESKNQQGGDTLPLHELMPCKGKNAISTTIMFKRNGIKITPGTRVQFWADPDKIDMLHQILFIKDQKLEMEPVRLPAGKIWVSIEQSVDIDILQEDEIVTNPKLELVILHVPKEWTVTCWLTESITTALIKDGASKSLNFAVSTFDRLMKAIMNYYLQANAPGLLKSVILRLVARLVVKIRFLYHQFEENGGIPASLLEKPHIEKLFVTKRFIENVISECNNYMKIEEEDIYNQNKAKLLYPAIVQDSAELLMKIALPVQKSQAFDASADLLTSGSDQLELPDWSKPLINVSHFLHFFRGETRLPQKLLDEVYKSTTKTHFKHHLDNVIVIRKIPSTHIRYTKTWIMEHLLSILKMHQARIIDPQRDICVVEEADEPEKFHSIVIFIDDFSHLRANDKDNANESDSSDDEELAPKIVPLYSETDDEKEDGEGDAGNEENAASAEEERPPMYNCGNVGVCGGFENDIDNETCVVCEAPRPPMEQLIEEFKAKRKAEMAEAKAAAAMDADSDAEEGEPLLHLRLQKIRRDLRHVISHDQRIIALQRLEEQKKAKEEAEAEEAKKKQEEEAAKAKSADGDKANEEAKPKEEEQKKDAQPVDSDASPEEDGIIDMDNLPEDRNERLRLIGVDQQLIDEGGEMLDIIEMSAMEEFEKNQNIKRQEQAERRKRRKAKEDARKALELKQSGGQEEVFKLEVSIMQEQTFNGDANVQETLSKALKTRLRSKDPETEQEAFEFSQAAKDMIQKFHKLFQTIEISQLQIPRDIEDKLADYGIRKETLKSNSTEDVIAKMKTIVLNDSISFFKLVVSQGFDLWLTQACYPVCDIKKFGIKIADLMKIGVLSKVRQLIETDFCKDRQIVADLDPALLRLVHRIPDQSKVSDFSNILNRGDTTDEEESKAEKGAGEEEEKKGEPDEVVLEEEKKELVEEEDKKESEDKDKSTKDQEARAKSKSDKQAKVKAVKEKLEKMKLATMWDFWQNYACNEKDKKSMTEEQKQKLDQVAKVLDKPKKSKVFLPWKMWAIKHANDRRLTWQQTLQSTRPISCFNDVSVKDAYAEVLDTFDQAQLRFVWAFLRIFNKNFTKTIRFINQTQTPIAVPESNVQPMSIGAYLSSAKDLCLNQSKSDLKYLIMNRTAINVGENDLLPKIVFTRLKDASGQQGDEKDKPKAKPQFIQAFEQIKNMNVSAFRQPQPKGSLPHLAFRVVFKGEDVEGDGGPYRQVFQDWSSELQVKEKQDNSASQEVLDLLKPCANQTGEEQIGKDRFVISTASNDSVDIQKYFFLGVLMGICCRTGVIFSLDLPKMFWKQLTGQRITLDDIIEVEWRFLRSMQQMLSFSKDVFEMMPTYWVTTLADDRQFDLTEDGDGDTKLVEYDERFDYIRQALMARLTETQAQIQAIRRGICQIIPESILNIATLDDIETWICGSCKPNIALLRKHTEYPKDEPDYAKDSQLIKNFWQFLDDITEEDKKKFIIFCWGQQRLPPDDAAFANSNISFKIKAHSGRNKRGNNVNMDDQLPTASTCFFHFTLPKYSSLDILTKKILIAVNNDCISMNAEVQRQHFREDENSEEE